MGDKGLMRAAVLATQLGFSIACPLVAFIGGGVWADGKFATGHLFFFVGLVLGLLAAAGAFYQVALAQPAKRDHAKGSTAPDKIETDSTDVTQTGSPGQKA